MSDRPDLFAAVRGPAQPVATIAIDVLPDGRCVMRADCLGRFHASYSGMPDARMPGELGRLLAELRLQIERAALEPENIQLLCQLKRLQAQAAALEH